MKALEIRKDWYWVGNLDPGLRVFDILLETEFGTSYNSYILKGSEKNVLFEATKLKCFDEFLERVKSVMPVEEIDYLVVSHTEPDHTGVIEKLLDIHPGLKIVATGTGIGFMKEICNKDFNAVAVKDGDEISLGNKTLKFIHAPNLHWPDTMFTYVPEDKTLVTCDAFGAHFSFEGITNDKLSAAGQEENYYEAMRYYFDMIMGPFKSFMLQGIAKIEDLEIETVCLGHGPVLVKKPWKNIEIYRKWASESSPNVKKTVVVPFVTAYGYTGMIADKIAEGIRGAGDIDVKAYDMGEADNKKVLDELFWADGILLGTPTIVGEALKPIWDLTSAMFPRTHGGKIASAFGSYGWSGEGVPHIIERLKQLRMKIYGEGLKIKFKPDQAQLQEAYEFGYNFGKSVLAGKIIEPTKPSGDKRRWKCVVCGEVVEGPNPPSACPVCGVGPEQFVELSAPDITFTSQKEERFIIVGNGAAGTSACQEIRKRNPVADIELISSEHVAGYNRPMLTKGILSKVEGLTFNIKPENWYKENNIKVTLNTTVTGIDAEKKTLTLSNGESRNYDKLVLAIGAESNVPAMEGVDLEGVFSIRSLKDIDRIKAYLPKAEKVAVIGGGVLGLEAAWEIRKAGKEVTLIQNSKHLMNKQLDARGSEILRGIVEKAGITVNGGTGCARITGSGEKAANVELKDGTVIEAQMVLFSSGIKANTEIAKSCGVEADRFILVNERMETNKKGIFACGDCAVYEGKSYGLWNQAIDMGKVAGANAAGDEVTYETIVPATAFSGMGTSLFSVGDSGKDPDKKYKSFEIYDEAKNSYEKLYFVNNRFVGGILIGDVSKSARLLDAFKKQEPMEKLL
jgi:flavorubredoxin/NADPH-dependent 2,4-dienoyl-CoA reductase/sulfur reductase-like enzyme